MPIPPVIAGLRDRPGMFVTTTSYDTVVAFLTGYDMALLGGLLFGFREWMIVRLESGNNLCWSGLIDVAAEAAHGSSLAAIDDGTRRQVLFDSLAQFFAERDDRDGVRTIFRRYEAWLATQPWSHA